MANTDVIKILMNRDGLTEDEAREQVKECIEALSDYFEGNTIYADPEEVIYDYLGLEPDYIFDLIG